MKNPLFVLALATAFAAPAVGAQSVFPDHPVNITAAARQAKAGPFIPQLRPGTNYTSLTPSNIPIPPRNTIVAGNTEASIDRDGTVHRRELAANKSKPRYY